VDDLKRTLTGYPNLCETRFSEPRLNISVVFTSTESTLAALKKADALASSLGACITLVVAQKVPFPLPLDEPPVSGRWNEDRLGRLAGDCPLNTTVNIFLCRDRLETLRSVLPSGSIVVVGCRNQRWFSMEARLARALRRIGHEVILTPVERKNA